MSLLLVEAHRWLDFVRLSAFHDGRMGYEFGYSDNERLPSAMRREDGAVFTLHFDQVGSLRVVVGSDGDVIKEILYDPFGGIIKDTNPGLRVPIGFAGGLHDRDLGFVRFGWRDYDTFTDRWTAPDPLGDEGGDPDWYGYCLDDPVNGNDPLGLMGSHPEAPEGPYETEPSFQDSWQWQASPKACEKCRALDGRMFFDDLSNAPEKPHPNCKCKLVMCFYHSGFSGWSAVKKGKATYSYPNPVVFPFSLNIVPVLLEKVYTITEERKRSTVRECGDRTEAIKVTLEQRDR
ncbi:RHS repeat-associated core domain-containing protein [Pseudodesulfovibrio sp.]|uniref:RHS repeat-associated core domain-containing protein n=1 Tax=unclassified Pseudodesulfovibrio TaxID=2661612 RepID=UPI003B00BC0E